ncbi:MAG: hypothetical protein NT027_01645, partial [Proteobacteria bacterium]|nr:hypothetical protein [Pseudomonadota bacterium]
MPLYSRAQGKSTDQKEKRLPKPKLKDSLLRRSDDSKNDFKVRTTFAAHDRTQLETVFDYPVIPNIGGNFRKQSYIVEGWFFFPAQMGVNPETYTKEKFYGDMRPLIRFREPRLSFKDLMGVTEGKSPIINLRTYIRSIRDGHAAFTIQRAISEARIFGCTFTSYFLKRMSKRTKGLKKVQRYISTHLDEISEDNSEVVEALDYCVVETRELLSKGMYLLRELRQLLNEAESLNQDYLRPIVSELRFVDEYCSYRFRDGLSSLMRTALELDQSKHCSLSYKLFLKRCVALNRLEAWYTRKHSYSWIDETSTGEQVEAYMYRRGTLKRR